MSVSDLVTAVAARTDEIVDALSELGDDALLAPSRLPEWSRLTIACHLRFGAGGFLRMTRAALAGHATAYYPDGRAEQRPKTLRPYEGEHAADVVRSLAKESNELQVVWQSLEPFQWELTVAEPVDNADLGPQVLERLPLLRLTEVEVHGSDLHIGLADWSDTFVRAALPFRLDWLNTRRTNHRDVDDRVQGSWLLRATDGPTYLVVVDGTRVESAPADAGTEARATIEASSRDLLALLLGRSLRQPPVISGDVAFAESFSRAFPGP